MLPHLLILLAACSQPSGDDTGDTGSDDTGSDDTAVADARADNLASGPGDYALALLRSDTYTSLLVEVDYVVGHAPDSSALDRLESELADLLDKPGGITVQVDDEIADQGAPTWSVQAAEAVEVANRDDYRDGDSGQAVIYYLYLDGHSDADDSSGKVLAYAYHGSSIIVFADTIASTGSGLPLGGGKVEATVVVHETGHLLGLVDNGIPMVTPHLDTAHGHHDSNDQCIMYWAVQTDSVADLLLGGDLHFDAECLADLAAARDN